MRRLVWGWIGLMGLAAAAAAATVKDVRLETSESEDTVRIVLDAPAQFRVYELDAPPRVVVMVPGAHPKAGLAEAGGGGGVERIAVRDTEQGARVEIRLKRRIKPDVRAEGEELVVRFAHPAEEKAAQPRAVVEDVLARDQDGITELVIAGRGLEKNYNAFRSAGGRRLILDFWNAELRAGKSHYSFPTQNVATVDLG
ncbi:MAG: AMIN domain-containing protein, partial [Zetaproteobacteria bacterium]